MKAAKQNSELQDKVNELQTKLDMARYAYHDKLKVKLQSDVDNIRMTLYSAEQVYKGEMARYDAMVGGATSAGEWERLAEMERGIR